MADKKLSAETNQLLDFSNDVKIYAVEDSAGTPVSGYFPGTDFIQTEYTAGDGMTLDVTKFNLGGTYTDSIAITTADGSKDFEISNTDSGAELHKIILNGTGVTVSSLEGDYNSILATTNGVLGSATMQAVNAANSTAIQVSPSYGAKITDTLFNKGFVGDADYSANYDSLTYVQKVYVDAHAGGQDLDATITSPGAGQDGYVWTYDHSNTKFYLAAGGGGTGTEIEDSTTTTGLYTEEESDILVGHSANTGVTYVLKLYEGSGTPKNIFGVSAEGYLYNQGKTYLQVSSITANRTVYLGVGTRINNTSSNSVFIGNSAGLNSVSTNATVAIGYQAGMALTGDYNTIVGYQAGSSITSGDGNVCFGLLAGQSNITQDNNTYIGRVAGSYTTGARNVFLGAFAGPFQTSVSDKLIINNRNHSNAAAELTNSIIVGDMAAAPANQRLHINAVTKAINLTGTQITALTGQSGDIVYNTTTNKLQCYNGSTWNDLF